MAQYSFGRLFAPQYVSNSSTALVFALAGAPVAMPSTTTAQITNLRVANVSGSPLTVEFWLVPAGASADATHVVGPAVTIPVATVLAPDFQVAALIGSILGPGDAVFAQAGGASGLVIHGDGVLYA